MEYKIRTDYRVTFDVIGKRKRLDPFTISIEEPKGGLPDAIPVSRLGHEVMQYVKSTKLGRRWLASRGLSIDTASDGTGEILTGHATVVGTFTFEKVTQV
jgi:hypothetical protein